ncbi:MAG: hypothetical protein ABS948_06600 [Solibacillus sp.]
MHNTNETLKAALLSKLTEVAVKHPEYLMMSVTECMSILAMNQFSGEEIAVFTREAFHIVDTYTTPEMLEGIAVRGSDTVQ